MSTLIKDKLLLILLILLSITIVSWMLAFSWGVNQRILGAGLLILAFLKVHLIVIHYMEAPKAGIMMRRLFEAWVLLVGVMTVGLYLR